MKWKTTKNGTRTNGKKERNREGWDDKFQLIKS